MLSISHKRGLGKLVGIAAATVAVLVIAPAGAALATTDSDDVTFTANAGSGYLFDTATNLGNFSAVTVTGSTVTADVNSPAFDLGNENADGAASDLTVIGDTTSGANARFAAWNTTYQTSTAIAGADTQLDAGALSWTSTTGTFTNDGGQQESSALGLSCSGGCLLDSATEVSIATAAANDGMGDMTLAAETNTVTLSTPGDLHASTGANIYRVDLLWTYADQ